jgi:hypothetical protein
MTDFSDHPVSLSEIKAERDLDGKAWTPRDVLLKLLRDIDSGKCNPDLLVVSYSEVVDGKRSGRFWQATPCGLLSLGLMQSTIFKMQE